MYLPRYLLTDCTSLICGPCDLHITYVFIHYTVILYKYMYYHSGLGETKLLKGGANLVAVLAPRSKLWGGGGKCGVTGLFSFAWKSHTYVMACPTCILLICTFRDPKWTSLVGHITYTIRCLITPNSKHPSHNWDHFNNSFLKHTAYAGITHNTAHVAPLYVCIYASNSSL